RGRGRLTEDNIRDTMRQLRMALLEADVALPVVREFIAEVSERAVGVEVLKSLTPGQAFIRVVHDELVKVMGEPAQGLDLRTQPPAVVMVAGLQGSGKTTTVAKLAQWLQQKEKKKVLTASADIYRPAAILQLERLSQSIGAAHMHSSQDDDPVAIARQAIEEGKRQLVDVVLLDTAGRLHIDDEMMAEVREVHSAAAPVETLFVLDSMAGQDAVNAARAFDEALPLTGIVLTKTDGDARGGAALSVRKITGKPIKFIGTGEKVDAFDLFHPDRVASRILGMGDVLSLVEQVQEKADKDKSEKLAKKLKKGKGFNLEDLRDQLEQMLNMGGMSGLLDKLPGMGQLPDAVRQQADDGQVRRQIALINSMTPGERRFPRIINGSRKRRIAAGSGQAVQDVNRLVKQHNQMQKMMKKMSKGGPKAMMRAMKGRLPPGMG
ncbi:MAG: signal recognition particle protein, partial [Gammaproteobacteria bacterium]|nr:signal recognition particle protein [Gammaproteobacteria bacterium]